MSTVSYRFIEVGPYAGAYAAVIDLINSRDIQAFMMDAATYQQANTVMLRCIMDDETDNFALEDLLQFLHQQSVDRLIVEVQLCVSDSPAFRIALDVADIVLIDGYAASSNLSDVAMRCAFKRDNTEPLFRSWLGSKRIAHIHAVTGLLPYVFISEEDEEDWGVAKMFAQDAKVGIPIVVQRDIWNVNLEPAELERMSENVKET